MAARGDRFRHLRTPETGDLFEHFGIGTTAGPTEEPSPTDPIVAVSTCTHCGWLRPLPLATACPMCGGAGRKDAG